ncbi:MAG: S-adenosylmethionine tRNA ribosyltransferase [Bacteroidetes bacterium 4572_117]|nr:MAG: S-adenosylmethionine tRNA ribosyltransferase [Bacteroidetes bacterium 4572_117]
MQHNYKNIATKDYNYNLSDERIAKYPLENRDGSNLLYLEKNDIKKTKFKQLPDFLKADDLLVFNNAKVIQARLAFKKDTGANIEIFCLEPYAPADYNLSFQSTKKCEWKCMVGNLKKWKTGGNLQKQIEIDNCVYVIEAEKLTGDGATLVVGFSWQAVDGINNELSFADILEHIGKTPLPPYLNRKAEKLDKTRYQTIYAKQKGSVAAPTAGLHFTDKVFDDLKKAGVKKQELTLHVGAGTFRPVKSETIDGHEMHKEHFRVEKSFLQNLINAKGRIVAVGTTSVRTLESLYWLGVKLLTNSDIDHDLTVVQWEVYSLKTNTSLDESITSLIDYMEKNSLEYFDASTQIIIVPGYKFKVINGLVTNFHQPQSTLLLLIAAIVGDKWKEIYKYALANGFRFLSYGDSSLFFIN